MTCYLTLLGIFILIIGGGSYWIYRDFKRGAQSK